MLWSNKTAQFTAESQKLIRGVSKAGDTNTSTSQTACQPLLDDRGDGEHRICTPYFLEHKVHKPLKGNGARNNPFVIDDEAEAPQIPTNRLVVCSNQAANIPIMGSEDNSQLPRSGNSFRVAKESCKARNKHNFTKVASSPFHTPGNDKTPAKEMLKRIASFMAKNNHKCPHSGCKRDKKRWVYPQDLIEHMIGAHELSNKDAVMFFVVSPSSSVSDPISKPLERQMPVIGEDGGSPKRSQNQNATRAHRGQPSLVVGLKEQHWLQSENKKSRLDHPSYTDPLPKRKRMKESQHKHENEKVSEIRVRQDRHSAKANTTTYSPLGKKEKTTGNQKHATLQAELRSCKVTLSPELSTISSLARKTETEAKARKKEQKMAKKEMKRATKALRKAKKAKRRAVAAIAAAGTGQALRNQSLEDEQNLTAIEEVLAFIETNVDRQTEIERGQWRTVRERKRLHPKCEEREIDNAAKQEARDLGITVEDFWEASAMALAVEEQANDNTYWDCVDEVLTGLDQCPQLLPVREDSIMAGAQYQALTTAHLDDFPSTSIEDQANGNVFWHTVDESLAMPALFPQLLPLQRESMMAATEEQASNTLYWEPSAMPHQVLQPLPFQGDLTMAGLVEHDGLPYYSAESQTWVPPFQSVTTESDLEQIRIWRQNENWGGPTGEERPNANLRQHKINQQRKRQRNKPRQSTNKAEQASRTQEMGLRCREDVRLYQMANTPVLAPAVMTHFCPEPSCKRYHKGFKGLRAQRDHMFSSHGVSLPEKRRQQTEMFSNRII